MTMTAQVFFATRSAARVASFGKMTDNGKDSANRWARSVEVTPSQKKETMTLTRTGRRGPSTQTTVVVKKMKTMVR
ncbi:hypothetical protein [Aeromonas phage AS-yj]|uniref:Uncharacterized protein n=4 Tax=Caudoviricetes TaxID=2731619 RepID=A0A291LDJ0_9CAUD|nr:hypothetical protein [Aeromonas phage AS-szw]ATI17648.1 hypothetical protein [Aeromonas phage AS-yj]QAX97886.1 hypothetical protein ASswx1_243 [Aeromonas phage Asswx_1]QAX99063.1 hypothetical protein assk_274 [Aeromonas phage Assk]QMV29081.1 hypothetical protein AP1_0374 [Aeromonas phage AP1]UKM62514.1 hypothetical protein P19_0026 [Aeromonas phage P19]